jgi:two-component system sensor histidine kinase RegB
MYFTGGANNPFVSYYIVPLVIAAAVLPWRYTWLIAGASILAYSLLLYVYVPFPMFTPHSGMHHGDSANVHVLGMWFNFLFSAALITYFVVRMAAILRRQESEAVKQREDQLRNDQIMAVASLAAGTAHELGTPLGTMALLAEELLADDKLDPQARRDIELIASKVAQCKATLTALSRTAEIGSVQDTQREAAGDFARRVLKQWSVRRPGIRYQFNCADNSPTMEFDPTMAQALENLLNNAADTGSADIAMTVDWDDSDVRIAIRDHGPGVPPRVMENLGKPVLHADRNGLGIGLMLTQATVERFGGRIALRNHPDGGAQATMILPIRTEGTT